MDSDMRLYGLRGAACAGNSREAVIAAVSNMCGRLFTLNRLSPDDIVSIQFTITPDLTAMNPAAALRKGNPGIDVSRCALFCSQEPVSDGMLPGTIRVLVTAYMKCGSTVHHVYTDGAEKLRPDFSGAE